jgi:hypothetical protein
VAFIAGGMIVYQIVTGQDLMSADNLLLQVTTIFGTLMGSDTLVTILSTKVSLLARLRAWMTTFQSTTTTTGSTKVAEGSSGAKSDSAATTVEQNQNVVPATSSGTVIASGDILRDIGTSVYPSTQVIKNGEKAKFTVYANQGNKEGPNHVVKVHLDFGDGDAIDVVPVAGIAVIEHFYNLPVANGDDPVGRQMHASLVKYLSGYAVTEAGVTSQLLDQADPHRFAASVEVKMHEYVTG